MIKKILVSITLLYLLIGCKSEQKQLFKLFYPDLLSETYFKENKINRINGVDVNVYSINNYDTTIIFQYEKEQLFSLSWEFPFSSEKELREFFDNEYQMLLTPLESCDKDSTNNYFFLQNIVTKHIFMGYLHLPQKKVVIRYDVIK